ncbi:MAG: carbohydrate-binding domain-containing protein [Eubacterium sp.]|nr:carbohydrate-binding domain-containing protein [Eubacterium sp.]
MIKRLTVILLSLLMISLAVFSVHFEALAASKPAAVASFKVSKTCKNVTLKWKKQKNAAGYQIYSAAKKNGKYKRIKTVTKNKAVIKQKLGKTRYYKVRAYKVSGSKKVFGKFSKIKGAKTAHAPSSSWFIEKKATCAQEGVKSNKCKYCKKKYTAPVEKDFTAHEYLGEYVEADDVNEGYTVYTCKLCGDKYNTAIKPHKFEAKVTAPTCTEQGYTTYKCSKCDRVVIGDYTDVIPHSYSLKYVPANCTDDGYTINYCTVCGYEDETSKSVVEPAVGTAHVYESKTVQPTCTEDGFTAEVCTVCGFVYEESKTDIVPALGHDFEEEYTVDEDYFRHHQCTRCDGESIDKTCYIDIGTETVSNPNYAAFKQSSTNSSGVNDKLDISTNEDGSIDFEITGSRSDFTIDINAVGRTEVKLNGVTLINDGRDCINVKNYAPLYDENGNPVTNEDGTPAYGEAPKVFISAKDGSENLLKVTTSGNGIDSRCPIELRGHGVLTIQSYGSTAIDNRAKIVIKNLTLDILSANRGIDTKDTVLVPGIGGVMVEDEVYFNIEIEDNANIKIKSADDCIRCKNMTVFELEEGHTATVVNLESTGGDGIQLEGNKGFSALSGEFTIKAKKYAFNCAENLIEIKLPAVVTVTGGTYAKPAE